MHKLWMALNKKYIISNKKLFISLIIIIMLSSLIIYKLTNGNSQYSHQFEINPDYIEKFNENKQ